MSLIFCNSTIKFVRNESALKTYCMNESIKLLRITREPETNQFTVVEMYPKLKIKATKPKLYSFIFELHAINPINKK